jgi:IS5 family transposase
MVGQFSLVDALVDPRLGKNAKLAGIDGMIDWQSLGFVLGDVYSGLMGRPPYPALAMLKALYLQSLYSLSDPGLEEALLDRLSFRRFCGFGLDQSTPDETTICRFRGEVARTGVLALCFVEINRQLEAKGLLLKKGTLVDASIVAAAHRPPKRTTAKGADHPKEPGAGWINKAGKSYFGYKVHIGIDQGSGLIRKALFTNAHVQDVEVAEHLVCGDEAAIYADRAYESKAHRRELKSQGIKDRIMHRRHKHLPQLPHWQQLRNHLIARRRAPVEAIFSAMKRIYGKARARCHSLLVNTADYLAFISVYNLRRAAILAT